MITGKEGEEDKIMKRKCLLLCAAILGVIALCGAENPLNNSEEYKNMPPAERVKMKTGGFILDTRKAYGGIYFVDATSSSPSQGLKDAAQSLQTDSWVFCNAVSATDVKFSNIGAKVAEKKWEAVVVLMDLPNLPIMLVQPEGRWAIINLAFLKSNNTDEQKLAKRIQKEALRAAAYLFGVGTSVAEGGLARPMQSVAELDQVISGRLPVDVFTTIQAVAPMYGIQPGTRTTYYRAATEGWAPPPTNKYQQAAWERVQRERAEMPTNPIRIMPESTKQK